MNGLELNKIAAAILLAGIIALVVGFLTDALYQPELEVAKRGYTIAGAEEAATAASGAAPQEAAKPVNILAFMGAADAAAGEALTKKCTACHDFSKGGPNKVGPNLWGALGREIAAHEGYAYSEALKSKGGKWDYQALSEFLTAPAKYAKGTKMAFAGISKPEERANLIAYLRSLSDSPLPIPEYKEEAKAEEAAEAAVPPAQGEAQAERKSEHKAEKAVEDAKVLKETHQDPKTPEEQKAAKPDVTPKE